MSKEHWRRLDVVGKLERGALTVAEAATALGISERQMKRVRKRVAQGGDKGVVHGNTGRAPSNKLSELVAKRIVELRRSKYDGFNDQHFVEKLLEEEKLSISRASVQRLLRRVGIGSPKKRRAGKHRRRRDRRPQAGQMILWDGSRHDWLEGRGPRMCLVGAVDDATGELLPGAHFVDQECTVSYLRVLQAIVEDKGVPVSAYMDRHSTLKRNDRHWTRDEELAGEQEPTQVGRALDELGIEIIYALSPQAKGRVERLWGTLQDRLVSELRLKGVTDIDSANEVLEPYRRRHNARFALPAADAGLAWRACPPGITAANACGLVYVRKVANDHTVRLAGEVLEISAVGTRHRSYAKALVTVRHLLDGRYRVFHNGKQIVQLKGAPPLRTDHTRRSTEAWLRNNEQSRALVARKREQRELERSEG
jgi:transposase